jgi:hypothetical protein
MACSVGIFSLLEHLIVELEDLQRQVFVLLQEFLA